MKMEDKLVSIAYWTLTMFSLMRIGTAQENTCVERGQCNAPFTDIPSNSPVLGAETNKTFDTTLTVVFIRNDTEINSTIFNAAANHFYSNDITLQGFLSLENMTVSENVVTYSVKYNYSLLKENATDAIIANTIGNVTYVTEGLNTTDFQDNYNVSDVSITGGNCLCSNNPDSICAGYPDYSCTSRRDGVNVTCTIATPYCLNGGFCFKNEIDGSSICSCQNTLNYWHVGKRCETMFHIWMVIVFFVVVGLVLFLVIPLITFYCIRTIDKRILNEKEKEEKKKLKSAAKELEKLNGAKTTKEENAPTALSSDVINSNGKANQKTAPFPAPRQNAPPMSPTSGDSFDDSTSSASNPESTPREDHHTNSDTGSNNPQTPGRDPFQADDNTYATITKTQPRQNPDSTSETSSSSSNNSESGGYNAGGTFFPPIPYHNPPAYANVPLPIASQNRQDPMVTTV